MAYKMPTTEPAEPLGIPQPAANLPSTPSQCVTAQAAALTIVRDLEAGNERFRGRGPTYLPRAPGEDADNYAQRLARSVLFNVFAHTVEGLVGFVFRRDPVLGDDVPAQIVEHWENIDLAGTHGDVFCRDELQDGLTAGHCAILVEYPATPSGTGGPRLTLEDEQPLRPYWVPIRKDAIRSFRPRIEQGKTVLEQVVIEESTMVPDGDYGEREQTRYRVLYNKNGVVGFRLEEVTKDKRRIVVDSGLYPTQVEIPLAEIKTSGRKSLFDSVPPLLDLAYLNIAHYQQWSDYAFSIHKTNVPFIFGAGIDQGTNEDGSAKPPMVVGPNTAILMPNPDATMNYVSHDGAALSSSKAALDDLKSDMATLGVAMLSSQKRVAETAEAKRIDKAAADSALGVTARGLQDGLEQALYFHARYLGLESGGSITINRDFDAALMEPDVMQAYINLATQLGFPVRALLEQMKAGGRINADVDLDDLMDEMAANAAAEADRKQQELDAQMAAQKGAGQQKDLDPAA